MDESTGMPHPWLYSDKAFTHKEYDAIYKYYTQSQVPAFNKRNNNGPSTSLLSSAKHKKGQQQKAASSATSSSSTTTTTVAAATSTTTKTKDKRVGSIAKSQQQQQEKKRNKSSPVASTPTNAATTPSQEQQKQQEEQRQSATVQLSSAARAAREQVATTSATVLTSIDSFRVAVGKSLLAQVESLKQAAGTAATTVKISLPRFTLTSTLPSTATTSTSATAPRASVEKQKQQNNKKVVAAAAAGKKTGPVTVTVRKPPQQQPENQTQRGVVLLARAEAFRQSLGHAVLSQIEAFKQTAGDGVAKMKTIPSSFSLGSLPSLPTFSTSSVGTSGERPQQTQPKEIGVKKNKKAATTTTKASSSTPPPSPSPSTAFIIPRLSSFQPSVSDLSKEVVAMKNALVSALNQSFKWQPSTVLLPPTTTATQQQFKIEWNPTNFAQPPRAALVAFGILGSIAVLCAVWSKATALRGEAVEGIDTEIIGARPFLRSTSSNTTTKDSESDENDSSSSGGVWREGSGAAADALTTVVGGKRAWESVGSTPGARSKEELMAEAQRRIEAAKEAVAKAELRKKEMEVAAVDAERKRAEREAKARALAREVRNMERQAAMEEEERKRGVTGAGRGRTQEDEREEERRERRRQAATAAAAEDEQRRARRQQQLIEQAKKQEASLLSPEEQQAQRQQRAMASAEHNPVAAFANSLDSRSHATPLLALIGLASAAYNGAVDVATGGGSSSGRRTSGDVKKESEWKPVDVLLAPAAPLLASLPSASSSSSSSTKIKDPTRYDAFIDVLRGALDSPIAQAGGGDKYSPVRELLDAAPPHPGPARYDFIRNIVRGLADAQVGPSPVQPFDMVGELLREAMKEGGDDDDDDNDRSGGTGGRGGARQKDKYCVVKDLLHTANMVEEWGPDAAASKYDPLDGTVGTIAASTWVAADWSGPSKYCPITALTQTSVPSKANDSTRAMSKYDPLAASLTWTDASGSRSRSNPIRTGDKYDVVGALFSAFMAFADPPPPRRDDVAIAAWDPVAVALDAIAGYQPPQPRRSSGGSSKYDPAVEMLSSLNALQPPKQSDGGARWDPLSWLLSGWAAEEWQGVGGAEGGASVRAVAARYDPLEDVKRVQPTRVVSKYDWAQAVLQSAAPQGPSTPGVVERAGAGTGANALSPTTRSTTTTTATRLNGGGGGGGGGGFWRENVSKIGFWGRPGNGNNANNGSSSSTAAPEYPTPMPAAS